MIGSLLSDLQFIKAFFQSDSTFGIDVDRNLHYPFVGRQTVETRRPRNQSYSENASG